jgi:hypothetical protein
MQRTTRAVLGGLAVLAAAACAPGRMVRSQAVPSAAGGARSDAPGAVALAPLGTVAAPCLADTEADARLPGVRRSVEFRDRPAGWARWERSVRTDFDSAGRPRYVRALAGTAPPVEAAAAGGRHDPTRDTVDVVQAWFADDGRVERGKVARLTAATPLPHPYWSGDPLPPALHGAVVRLARAAAARCAR